MDEKGVKLKSEAHVSIGCSEELVPHPTHLLIFDKPFLVMLQQSNAKAPYLAMWIGNAETPPARGWRVSDFKKWRYWRRPRREITDFRELSDQ